MHSAGANPSPAAACSRGAGCGLRCVSVSPLTMTRARRCKAFVDSRFGCEPSAVDFKKAHTQNAEQGLGYPREGEIHQGGRTMRYEAANALERQRLAPLLLQQL